MNESSSSIARSWSLFKVRFIFSFWQFQVSSLNGRPSRKGSDQVSSSKSKSDPKLQIEQKNDWISSTGESSDRLSITLHKGLKDRFYVNLLFWRSNFRFYLEIGINPLTLVKQKVYSINYWLFWLFYLFTKKIILIKPEVTSLFLLTPGYYNRFKIELIWLVENYTVW